VIVDAKDAEAVAFYKRFGFVEFPTVEARMFLPMISVANLFVENSVPDPAHAESSAPADTPPS
jgi:hypothetical protein